MRRLTSTLFLALAACGPPPTGSVTARISADPALAAAFTTEDGWTLTFTHVVVAVSSFAMSGDGVVVFSADPKPSKLIDLVKQPQAVLGTNTAATPRSYGSLSIVFSRVTGSDENVNVDADVATRMGARSLYLEGTATKQSTTRAFQLGLPMALVYEGCLPQVTVEAKAEATVDYRVHAQRAFIDDAGKLRFEAWGLADASPQDGLVLNAEVAVVNTSTLPAAQYGATSGSLLNVLEKRSLTMVGLGDSGTCVGE